MIETWDRRIIVVEDDELTRKLLLRQLETAGYTVEAYGDGRSALQPINTMGSGMVIADWSMPEVDGLELCRMTREMQNMQALGNIYFILLTAHSAKTEIVQGLEAGADDYLTKPYHQGELLARVRVGGRMLRLQAELLQRNIDVQKANAQMAVLANKLEMQANTDGLTALPNRRCLFERLEEAWKVAEREGHALSCVMLDIDRFKIVNDTYGHAVGDVVLKRVAECVRDHARRPDLIGRFGGEEFLLVYPVTSAADAGVLAEKLRADVAALRIDCGVLTVRTSVSCGVAEKTAGTGIPDELLRNADAMMYAAKEHGRNQTWVCVAEGKGQQVGEVGVIDTPGEPPPGARVARGGSRGDAETLQSAHADTDHE